MSPTGEKKVVSPILDSFQGSTVSVTTPSALPPGSRVSLALPVDASTQVDVRGKVVSVLSAPGGKFAIKIRLHSVTKQKEALLRRIQNSR